MYFFATHIIVLKEFMTSPEAAACCKHTLELHIWSRATHWGAEVMLQTWFTFSQMDRLMKPSILGTDTSCISSTPAGICQHFFFPCLRILFLPQFFGFCMNQIPAGNAVLDCTPFRERLAWWTACLEKGSSGSPGSLQPATPSNSSPILPLTLK